MPCLSRRSRAKAEAFCEGGIWLSVTTGRRASAGTRFKAMLQPTQPARRAVGARGFPPSPQASARQVRLMMAEGGKRWIEVSGQRRATPAGGLRHHPRSENGHIASIAFLPNRVELRHFPNGSSIPDVAACPVLFTGLSQQMVHFLQLRHDVDVSLAGGHAVAAGNAGRAILGKRPVFGPRP